MNEHLPACLAGTGWVAVGAQPELQHSETLTPSQRLSQATDDLRRSYPIQTPKTLRLPETSISKRPPSGSGEDGGVTEQEGWCWNGGRRYTTDWPGEECRLGVLTEWDERGGWGGEIAARGQPRPGRQNTACPLITGMPPQEGS